MLHVSIQSSMNLVPTIEFFFGLPQQMWSRSKEMCVMGPGCNSHIVWDKTSVCRLPTLKQRKKSRNLHLAILGMMWCLSPHSSTFCSRQFIYNMTPSTRITPFCTSDNADLDQGHAFLSLITLKTKCCNVKSSFFPSFLSPCCLLNLTFPIPCVRIKGF